MNILTSNSNNSENKINFNNYILKKFLKIIINVCGEFELLQL